MTDPLLAAQGCLLLFVLIPATIPSVLKAVGDQPAMRAMRSQSPGPDALNLESAITFALQNNPDIGAADTRVREAGALVRQRIADRLPIVTLNGGVIRQGPRVPSFNPDGEDIIPGLRTFVGVSMFQPLYDAGLRISNKRAAQHQKKAEQAFYIQTREDLTLAVSRAFYDVLRGQQLSLVALRRLEAANAQLRNSQALVGEGVAPPFDVIRNQAEVANAEQGLIEANTDTEVAEASFNQLLGRDIRSTVLLAEQQLPPETGITMDQALVAAMERRPELAGLRQAVKAALQDVRVARTGDKPAISLQALFEQRTATGLGFDHAGSYGVVMLWPFWDSQRTRFATRQKIEVKDRRQYEFEAARNVVEREVRQALQVLMAAYARIRTSLVERDQAVRSFEIADIRYRAGRSANVEVTDALAAAATGGANVANARYDYLIAIRALERATGATLEEIMATVVSTGGG